MHKTQETLDAIKTKLIAHTKTKPSKPKLRCIMRTIATKRAMFDAAEGKYESMAFVSDEAHVLIKGGAMSDVGVNNALWDGATLVMDRSDDTHIVVENPIVSFSMMVQKKILDALFEKRGDELRGSGLWARYLVAHPRSTQGYRQSWNPKPAYPKLEKFHERTVELLQEGETRIAAGNMKPEVLEFSEDAARGWQDFANNIENQLAPGQYCHDIKDFASKAPEIACRLAGVMHVFSKQEGKISVDTLGRAIEIVEWHLCEFKKLFSPEMEIPEHWINAQKLEKYLYEKHWLPAALYNITTLVSKNAVLREGPVRTKAKFDAALNHLVEKGVLFLTTTTPADRPHQKTCRIELRPEQFNAIHMARSAGYACNF